MIRTDKQRIYIHRSAIRELSRKAGLLLGNLNEITNRYNTYDDDELFSVEEIAQFSGFSSGAIRRWMVESNIEKTYITTDKKRLHITFRDAIMLVAAHGRRMRYVSRSSDIVRKKKRSKDLYSLKEAAKFLGVSTATVQNWIGQEGIRKRYINTDIRLVYIRYSDVLALKERGRREAEKGDLCTIEEAMGLTGVSKDTLYAWIRQSQIQKQRISADRRQTYIRRSDLLKFEEQYRPKPESQDELYTLKQVAQALSISVNTVMRRIVTLNIPTEISERGRRQIYIHHSDLLRLQDLYPQSSEPQERLYTLKIAAQTLGVSLRTLDRRIEQLGINKVRVGANERLMYIRESDVVLIREEEGVKVENRRNRDRSEHGGA